MISLAVLVDGRLASGSRDFTIRLWDTNGGKETAKLQGVGGSVNALAALPDGRLAFTCPASSKRTTDCGAIQLWDINSAGKTARLEGHSDWANALAVLPDGRLASGSADKTVRLWDTSKCSEAARFKGHNDVVYALATVSGSRLVSGSRDRIIGLWNVNTGNQVTIRTTAFDLRRNWFYEHEIYSLVSLQHGQFAGGSENGVILVWDTPDIREDHTKWGSVVDKEPVKLIGHQGTVYALTVLPDGCLASGSNDKTIRLWNSYTEIACLDAHGCGVTALAVLPDGRLASGLTDKTIRLWDTTQRSETALLRGHDGKVISLAVLGDGRLASGSWDETIRLWDVAGYVETGRLEGHRGRVTALSVLSEGSLASASSDQTIRIWDVKSGKERTRLDVGARVFCLSALEDKRLVAGDTMGRIHWLEFLDEAPLATPHLDTAGFQAAKP